MRQIDFNYFFKRIRKVAFATFFILHGAFFISSAQTDTLQSLNGNDSLMTAEKAIEIALKNNYSIIVSRNLAEMAKNNNIPGNAGMLPALDLEATDVTSDNTIKQNYSTGTEFNKSGVTSGNLQAYATLSWTIFDGLYMFATKERLSELEAQGELSLRLQIENTVAQTIQVYYNIVQQRQLVKSLNEEITVSQEREKIADLKFANGSGAKLDLLQAKLDLNAQQSALITQTAALENSKVNLNQLLARPVDIQFHIVDTVIISYYPTLEQLKISVFQRNNQLLFTERNIRLSELSLKQVQSQRYPHVSIMGNYLYSKVTNAAGLVLLNQNAGFNYGFTATIPLFHGFAINSQVKNAKLGITDSQLQFDDTKLQIESSLLNTYREFQDNLQILKLEEENIQYARESMNIALERFRVGLSNFVDLKVAQTSFEDAVSRLVAARYNAKISETNLMKLNGDLVK